VTLAFEVGGNDRQVYYPVRTPKFVLEGRARRAWC